MQSQTRALKWKIRRIELPDHTFRWEAQSPHVPEISWFTSSWQETLDQVNEKVVAHLRWLFPYRVPPQYSRYFPNQAAV